MIRSDRVPLTAVQDTSHGFAPDLRSRTAPVPRAQGPGARA
jgi:hypothetical protein